MRTAVIYARDTSTHAKTRTAQQIEACKIYAQKHGLIVEETYIDTKPKRKSALRKLLRQNRKHNWDVVIICSLDRFGRKFQKSRKVLVKLHKQHTHIHIANMDLTEKEFDALIQKFIAIKNMFGGKRV